MNRPGEMAVLKEPDRFSRLVIPVARIFDPLTAPVCRLYEIREDFPRKVDCIIGLAAGLKGDGSASPMTRSVAERCSSLYADGLSQMVIFTGGYSAKGTTEAGAMLEIAVGRGVPRERIALDEMSFRTHHHPGYVGPILREHNARSVLVVAHHLQGRRARAIFHRYYGDKLRIYFANVRSDYELTPQRRYACQTTALAWNMATHLLARLRGWA
jgi:uncharacterized SAM-binding protein YcdF (DUF218 family)